MVLTHQAVRLWGLSPSEGIEKPSLGVKWLKIIVKCPLVNIFDSLWIKIILGVFRCVNCFKSEKGERINNIQGRIRDVSSLYTFSLFHFVRFCCNFIFRRALIGQMPTFSTIIRLSLMATPFSHSPRRTFSWGYCSWGGSSLPPVYKQFRCFPLYFLK